jgi:hypothetical protein
MLAGCEGPIVCSYLSDNVRLMSLSLLLFEVFLAVAWAKSFRGADVLHLTQPGALAARDRAERELGARLFDRLGRSVALTETGRILEGGGRRSRRIGRPRGCRGRRPGRSQRRYPSESPAPIALVTVVAMLQNPATPIISRISSLEKPERSIS